MQTVKMQLLYPTLQNAVSIKQRESNEISFD